MAGAGDGVGAHQHTSSLQSFSAIGDGAAESRLTTPRSRRQVVFRAPRLDCDSDESVLAVKHQLRRDDFDARSRARGRKFTPSVGYHIKVLNLTGNMIQV